MGSIKWMDIRKVKNTTYFRVLPRTKYLTSLMPRLHEPKTSSFSQRSFYFPTFFASFDYGNWILEPFEPYWSHFC